MTDHIITSDQRACIAFASQLAETISHELSRPVTPASEGEIKHSIQRAQSIVALLTEALT